MSYNNVSAILQSNWRLTSLASKVWPTMATGITATANAAAWTLGTAVILIPADTITGEFDIQRLNIEAMSANGVYELVLYEDSTEKARVRLNVMSIGVSSQEITAKMISCEPFDGTSDVKVAIASSTITADTIQMSAEYNELG